MSITQKDKMWVMTCDKAGCASTFSIGIGDYTSDAEELERRGWSKNVFTGDITCRSCQPKSAVPTKLFASPAKRT